MLILHMRDGKYILLAKDTEGQMNVIKLRESCVDPAHEE